MTTGLGHPDPVVREVLDIWTARLLGGGIPFGDLVRTLDAVGTWDDWGPAWIETAGVHERLGEEAMAEGRLLSARDAFLAASRCYHLSSFLSVTDLGMHRHGVEKMVETHDRVLALQEPPVEKVSIPFEGGGLRGLLSLPAGPRPAPVVIVLPGLDSTKETRHAGRGPLLRRGLAVLSLDGPGQGEVGLRLPLRHDYEVAVAAAIDLLETREEVDAGRVAVYGSSLGGYYACRAAGMEPRVRAAVENCGPYDWGECFAGLPMVTRRAFTHYSDSTSEEEAAEKAALLTLREVMGRIRVPLFVVHGGRDPLIPVEQARRIAEEAGGPTTYLCVEEGGHGVNDLPYRFAPRVHDWLAEQLGGRVS